jgi:hypothetical protein
VTISLDFCTRFAFRLSSFEFSLKKLMPQR